MAPLVLVVEDGSAIRDLVRRYLERDGNVVLSTGSGAEAIAMAPDAVRTSWSWTLACRSPGSRGGAGDSRGRRHPDRDADRAVG